MRDLVSDFKELPSASTESNPLHGMLQSLSPYEWRDLYALMSTRTFQRDIIGSLPIELVMAIFHELDLVAPLVCRRVCIRWKDLLSAEFQRSLLLRWVSPNDPPLEGEGALTPLEACNLRAEHVLAVINCRPFRIAMYRIPRNQSSPTLHGYDFALDTFAWIHHSLSGETTVLCRNFRTGQEQEFKGEGRENISCLALTSKIVGFTTFSGVCYACDLVTRDRRSFQIPSANVKVIVGRATYLVVLLGSGNDGSTVIFWDYVTGKSTSFGISHQISSTNRATGNVSTFPPARRYNLLVDSNGRSVVVFDQVTSSDQTVIQSVRYSPNGNIINQQNLIVKHPIPYNIRHTRRTTDIETWAPERRTFAIVACDNNGNFMLTSFVGSYTRQVVFYNEYADKLSLHEYDNPDSEPRRNIFYSGQWPWFLWRNVAYIDFGPMRTGATVYDQMPTSNRTAEILSDNVGRYSRPPNHQCPSIFGNGSFISQFNITHRADFYILYVNCFEKNIVLPRWDPLDRISEIPRRDAKIEDDSDDDGSDEDDSHAGGFDQDDSNEENTPPQDRP